MSSAGEGAYKTFDAETPGNEEEGEDGNSVTVIKVKPKSGIGRDGVSTGSSSPRSREIPTSSATPHHGVPELVGSGVNSVRESGEQAPQAQGEQEAGRRRQFARRQKEWFAYVRTKEFWIVLLIGQVLSISLTGQNTFSTLLVNAGSNIPAFQSLLNYALLTIVYSSYTMYRYGFKGWAKMVWKDGWRYIGLAFFDVEGNYFFVLAYRYTTILSAQLINFWAIAVVVIVSLIFLGVRYHLTQYAGILICVGGMGMLIGSDHITGANGGHAVDQVKGDLFALLGASFYGLSNIYNEFLVSKRPLYEVVGQLSFWGTIIIGVQGAIFDREAYRNAEWDGTTASYFVGFTLLMFLFYTLTPLLFRLSSAAFFNISLLTANFWGVLIGLRVFHLHVHWMYPIAFALILVGLIIYFLSESLLGEAKKPWLGENQEQGVTGVGTAKWKLEKGDFFSFARKPRAGDANATEGPPGPGVA